MKKGLTIIIMLAAGLLILGALASVSAEPTGTESKAASKALTAHDPIYINGNSEFTAANGVTSGSGTESDPYIIEGWEIASDYKGSRIENTDAHFIMRNCKITDDPSVGNINKFHGLALNNVSNASLDNITIFDILDRQDVIQDGIRIEASSCIRIANCEIHDCKACGIDLWNGNAEVHIDSCIVYGNSQHGIVVGGDRSATLTTCTVTNTTSYSNGYHGFAVRAGIPGSSSSVINSEFYDNGGGSSYDGIAIELAESKAVIKGVDSHHNAGHGISVFPERGYGGCELFIADCEAHHHTRNYGVCLSGFGATDSIEVNNLSAYENIFGLHAGESQNAAITNSTFYNNSDVGVTLGSKSLLSNCRSYDNGADGIYLRRSDGAVVTACRSYNNKKGITIDTPGASKIIGGFYNSNSEADIWLGSVQLSGVNITGIQTINISDNVAANFLNTSLPSNIAVPSTSTLNNSHYIHVKVTDSAGNPVKNAELTVMDKYDAVIFADKTNAEGWCRDIQALEYSNQGGNVAYYTPHLITATKDGITSSKNVNVGATVEITLTLDGAKLVLTPQAPPGALVGQSFTCTAKVSNPEDLGGRSGNLTIEFYREGDAEPFSVKTASPLAEGEETAVVSNETSFASAGTHTIIVKVSSDKPEDVGSTAEARVVVTALHPVKAPGFLLSFETFVFAALIISALFIIAARKGGGKVEK